MINRTFASLGAFGREFPGIAADLRKRLAAAAEHELGATALTVAKALTPVGGALGRDPHAGQLKRSWQRRMGGGEGGQPEAVGSDVIYGSIINRGRRRSKTTKGRARTSRKGVVTQKGKMLGSPFVRSGITRPAVRLLLKNRERLAAKIVAKVEGGAR